jgi:TolB-like protein/Tfp pilus assembly protein PilF
VPLKPGQTLLHYRIVEKIGEGGMGQVWRAEDERLKRNVAIKFLPEAMAADPARLELFQREAETIASLDHPNIVTIHSVEEVDGVHFLVMGLVEGRTLDEVVPEGGLDGPTFFKLAIPIVDALAAAHDRGVIHRDVKPTNIMINREGRVRVLDFGLAKLGPAAGPGDDMTRTVTTNTSVVGTVPYMSPEQLEAKPVDPRSDIFSLGAVLYEMATGRRPFDGDSSIQVVTAIMRDEPQSILESRSDLPERLTQVVQQCLQKTPDARLQTAMEVREELRSLKRESTVSGPARPTAGTTRGPKSGGARRRWLIPAALAVVVLATGGWWLSQRGAARPSARVSAPVATGSTQVPRIAVLPLTNLSGDPGKEYFADGMTEALITDLAKIGGLQVISRSSVMRYKQAGKPLQEIADELGVDYLIEGSVIPAGEQVRITAQLIHVASDTNLWAENYDERLEDILSVQGRVALAVAQQVQVQLSPRETERLAGGGTVDARAYPLYLQGRFNWNRRTKEGFERSLELFEEALRIDPDFAMAHAGKADALTLLGEYSYLPPDQTFPAAKKAALRALELDDTLGEAHAALGETLHYHDWDLAGAEEQFKMAIELSPGYATAHQWYAEVLTNMGRFEESLVHAEKAVELDPHSPIVRYEITMNYHFSRRYNLTLEQALRDIERDPEFWVHHWGLASIYSHLERHDEAIEAGRKAVRMSSESPFALCALGWILARAGEVEEARQVDAELEAREQLGIFTPFRRSTIHIGLGDFDRAFELLEEAVEIRDPQTVLVSVWPVFDPLRDDPRLDALMRRMGLGDWILPPVE